MYIYLTFFCDIFLSLKSKSKSKKITAELRPEEYNDVYKNAASKLSKSSDHFEK